MKLKAINEQGIDINGTSLKGCVVTTRGDLTRAFGEPNDYTSDGDKVNFEWRLQFEDADGEYTATIYDWKNYDTILKEDELYQWHVGGRGYHGIVQAVSDALFNRGGVVLSTTSRPY